MTTFYEGTDLDGWLSHFFPNERLSAIVRKVLNENYVEDFNALFALYQNPTAFYTELEKENSKAYAVLEGMFKQAALFTKAWEVHNNRTSPIKEDGDVPPIPRKAPVRLPALLGDGEESQFDRLVQDYIDLPCFERAALVVFQHLCEKTKDPLINKCTIARIFELIEEMKRHGKNEDLDSDAHNFQKIFSIGLKR